MASIRRATTPETAPAPLKRVAGIGYAVVAWFGFVAVDLLVYAVTRHPLAWAFAGVMEVSLALTFIGWFIRVYGNAVHWGPQRYRAGWVLGGWVVPIGFLWIPAAIAADTWRATTGRRDLPWHLFVWWAAWLLAWLTGVHTVSAAPPMRHGLFAEIGGTTPSAVCAVVAAVAGAVFVHRLSAAQTARLTGR